MNNKKLRNQETSAEVNKTKNGLGVGMAVAVCLIVGLVVSGRIFAWRCQIFVIERL